MYSCPVRAVSTGRGGESVFKLCNLPSTSIAPCTDIYLPWYKLCETLKHTKSNFQWRRENPGCEASRISLCMKQDAENQDTHLEKAEPDRQMIFQLTAAPFGVDDSIEMRDANGASKGETQYWARLAKDWRPEWEY